MTIKVYGAPLSPMVRKVLLALDLKKVSYELDPIAPFPAPPEYLAINPLGKIPSYQDDDITLGDSSVICDYIEHKFTGYSLYPQNLLQRAKALWFEEYADTKLFTVLGPNLFFERVVKQKLFQQPHDEAKVQHSITVEIPPTLDYLESQLPQEGFLFGQLYMADITIASCFINAKYADYTVDPDRWPVTANYLNRVWENEVFAARIAKDMAFLTR